MGHSAYLPKHPYISGCTACLQFVSIFIDCFNLEIFDNYHAATVVGMLGRGVGRIFIMGAKTQQGVCPSNYAPDWEDVPKCP